MNPNDDPDLRERFAALREEDTASAPSLAWVLGGPAIAPPRRFPPLVAGALLATAAVATAVVLVVTTRSVVPGLDAAIAQAQSMSSWTAPTDAWLTLSGLEIPDSVPSLQPSSVRLPESSAAPTATGEAR